jgi:hypothetical protein
VLARFVYAGVDIESLSVQLQRDGVRAFVNSWNALLGCISEKSAALVET